MQRDARELDRGAVVRADLCVAGAGAAGITIAREFLAGHTTVVLLEGGGLKREPASQGLYAGHCDSPLADTYLEGSRLRFFGGTTNHWLGYCRPLDAIDFEARDWVPGSGWPISRAELDRFYERAAETCRVESTFEPDEPLGDSKTSRIRAIPFHVHALRFAEAYGRILAESPNILLHLNADVVRVAMADHGRRVDHLAVATPEGRRFRVEAAHFVLALGGIENARMLLVSDDVHTRGVGNAHDRVGRYFMEHAVFPVASVCAHRPSQLTDRSFKEIPGRARFFRLASAAQRRHRILNCLLGIGLVPRVEDTREQLLEGRRFRAIERFLETRGAIDESASTARPRRAAPQESALYFRRFNIRPEPVPNPESRVRLADEVDPFGRRRTHLAWRLKDLDFHTARRSLEILAEDMGRQGLGRVRLDPEAVLERAYSPGFHHMGATRMQDDPKRGVVDRDCRVHDVENLFIAGSSVFATSGYANPTFTLVALAIRLADHLKARLGSG